MKYFEWYYNILSTEDKSEYLIGEFYYTKNMKNLFGIDDYQRWQFSKCIENISKEESSLYLEMIKLIGYM